MKPLLKASDEAEFKRRYQSIMSPYNADNEWRLLQHAGIAEKPLEEGWYWCEPLLPWRGASQTAPCHWDKGIWWIPTPDGRQSIKPHTIGPAFSHPHRRESNYVK